MNELDFITLAQFLYAIANYEISLMNSIWKMINIFHEIDQTTVYENKEEIKHIIPKVKSFFIDEDGIMKPIYLNPITEIKSFSFHNCTNLISATLPYSVIKIGDSAFQNCIKLNKITLNDGIKNIGNGAFRNCMELTKFTIPSSIDAYGLGDTVFMDCKKLIEISIPFHLKVIRMFSFSGCRVLRDVRLPENMEIIGSDAFSECESIKKNGYSR